MTKSFTIYPAIDMRGGRCVRLLQGDYEQETVYSDSPFDMAKSFAEMGASWIHMVDLDGAKEGSLVNDSYVLKAARELKDVSIQIGGGIRSERQVNHYLENGVARVILGSIAVREPAFAEEMIRKYPGQIAIGLDGKSGKVATDGWLETSEWTVLDLGKYFADKGAEWFIFTDIANDGMLSGPNVSATAELARITGKNVIASGGMSRLEDIAALKQHQSAGIEGVIIGKALYENRFTLPEALLEAEGKV